MLCELILFIYRRIYERVGTIEKLLKKKVINKGNIPDKPNMLPFHTIEEFERFEELPQEELDDIVKTNIIFHYNSLIIILSGYGICIYIIFRLITSHILEDLTYEKLSLLL